MIATPKIEMKPTAAEILKFVPVKSNAQTPPIERSSTLENTITASSTLRKAIYSKIRIIANDAGTMNMSRCSASCISSNSPLQTARYGASKSCLVFSWASATRRQDRDRER